MPHDRRLLLLEFVTPERWVWDSRYFPFILGCAEELGIEARWLCHGVRIQTEKTGPAEVRQYAHLEADELRSLDEHLSQLRPTHVVLSHPVSDAVMERLRAHAGETGVLLFCDHPGATGSASIHDLVARQRGPESAQAHLCWAEGRTDWLLDWLGEDTAQAEQSGQYLVEAFRPSYAAVMANAAAREYRPHLILMGGVACDHFARVEDHPRFADLDLSECTQRHGCAYCTWYRGPTSELRADPVRAAETQLRQVLATAGEGGRFTGVCDVHDIRLFTQGARFFEMVLGLALPPCTFCFEPRVDRFLRAAPDLARVLPRLAVAGHRIYLFRMGLETLVEEENALYNKHVSLEQIDAASARLRELARAHPDAFEFDPTYGYITCSPWTTLEMFESGIERALERGFDPLDIWLYTPLLLYRDAPITRLAEREGCVIEQHDDVALLYEPSVNQVTFDSLRAWKFQDERTAVAFGLIVRFCAAALRDKQPDTIFEGDALYEQVLAADCGKLGFARPDVFARELVRAVRDSGAPYDRPALLAAAVERYRTSATPLRDVAPPEHSPFARRVREALAGAGETLEAQTGFAVGDVRLDGARAWVHLLRDGRPLILLVESTETAQRAFRRGVRVAVSHERSTPPDSRDRESAIEQLVALLDERLDAAAASI